MVFCVRISEPMMGGDIKMFVYCVDVCILFVKGRYTFCLLSNRKAAVQYIILCCIVLFVACVLQCDLVIKLPRLYDIPLNTLQMISSSPFVLVCIGMAAPLELLS